MDATTMERYSRNPLGIIPRLTVKRMSDGVVDLRVHNAQYIPSLMTALLAAGYRGNSEVGFCVQTTDAGTLKAAQVAVRPYFDNAGNYVGSRD